MKKSAVVFIIEPIYHGLQYVEVLKKKGVKYVIVKRHKGPFEITDEDVIYEDSLNADSIAKKISEYLKTNPYSYKGILPGNDFCVPIAFAVAEKLGLKSNKEVAGIYSRNKELMREQLKLHNIDQPQSKSYKTIEEIKKDKFEFPVVVKPSDMTGSSNVQLVYTFEELIYEANVILNLKDNILGYHHNNIVLVEEFVKGPEFSTELFLENGELVFSNVTEKQKGDLPFFVEIGHVVPSSITNEDENRLLIETGFNAAKAIQILNGPVHAEMVLCNGQPKIIELTARIGGDNIMKLVDLATGIYIPEIAIRQCLGETIGNLNKNDDGAAICFITAKPGIIDSFDGEVLSKCKNIVEQNISIKKADIVNNLTCSDDRLGYVIAVGKNGLEAKCYAAEAVKKINIKTK